MGYNPNLGRLRGANMIAAHPQRLESTDGTRWALGRNVKGEGRTPGTYVGVEVWTLRTRDDDGKVVTVASLMSKKSAEEWVGPRWRTLLLNMVQGYR